MSNPYFQRPISKNFDGQRFFNPGEPETDRSLADLLRWRLLGKRAIWPEQSPVATVIPSSRVEGLRATMVGHATLLIQAAGLNVLTDPVWSERASPVSFAGPKRATAPGIAFKDLPQIDVVLLSHNHYDHMDLATLARLHERDAPLIVTPLGNDKLLRRQIGAARVLTGNWGDSVELPQGADVAIVPANHWSARGMRDRRMALWGGFVLRTKAGTVYFAGDTGYGTGRVFRDIHDRYGRPDLALIPIGAYEPRWFLAAQHCDPSEAVEIMLALGKPPSLGIHWGTFCLTDEPREEPAALLAKAVAAKGLEPESFVAAVPGTVWTA